MKIIITEEERLGILGLHNENYVVNKKVMTEQLNTENGIYYVQNDQGLKASRDFNTVFPKVIKKGTPVYHNYKVNDTKVVLGNTGVVFYCKSSFPDSFIYNDSITDLKNDKFMSVLKSIFCDGTNIKPWRELTKGSNEVKPPPGSAVDTENPKDGLKIDANCKNKNPYNAFVDAGLNWKVERQKWIDAKCNGTTPCILGNATTNINLRNALCSGTWPLKKDTPQTPEQIQACSSKCEAKPTQPGQVGAQVQGWFNSDDNVCYEGTGTAGFASKEECEACKCPKKSPQQQVVTNTVTQASNTTTNTASTLKQFPELIFGDKTK
jgi:hypothetical protein